MRGREDIEQEESEESSEIFSAMEGVHSKVG